MSDSLYNELGIAPLQALFLFPVYADREDYKKKTGKEAPPYNPALPVKTWEDPAAASKRVVTYFYATWDRVNAPKVESIDFSGRYAAQLNLLPENFTAFTDEEKKNAADMIPIPIRELLPHEALVGDMFAGILVRDTTVEPKGGAGSFSSADRALLHKIAEALGVK